MHRAQCARFLCVTNFCRSVDFHQNEITCFYSKSINLHLFALKRELKSVKLFSFSVKSLHITCSVFAELYIVVVVFFVVDWELNVFSTNRGERNFRMHSISSRKCQTSTRPHCCC